MADEQGQERTERATERKRERARQKGTVCSSREIPSVAVMAGSILMLSYFGSVLLAAIIKQAAAVWREAWIFERWKDISVSALLQAASPLAFIFIILCVIGVFFNVVQIGWNFAPNVLAPKFTNIDPVAGAKRLFSLRGLAELLKSILKLAVIGLISYSVIKNSLDLLSTLGFMDIKHAAGIVFVLVRKLFTYGLIAFAFIAAADYGFQKYQYEKSLKMTRQEVKEEFREHEGDPHVKARLRKVQLEFARRRMMAEVPKAEVVITNPTHIAVALKYRPHKDAAPVVVAKGKGWLAQKIRELAQRYAVPIVERPELARELYRWVRIGQAVPIKLYQAVAEVLAYLYKLRRHVRI